MNSEWNRSPTRTWRKYDGETRSLRKTIHSPEAIVRLIKIYDAERAPGEAPETFLGRLPPQRVTALLADLEQPQTYGEDDFIDLDEQKQFAVQLSEGECAS